MKINYNITIEVYFHNYIKNGGKNMDLDINLSEISHDDLITLYNKTKEFVAFLDNEIETSEVEKKTK